MEFKENFFEKEVRCGFEVSKMMKRAWAAEIDLLTILLEVCDKYNIQCYADSGTLLGAVRHKGFIPWDDDIDMTVKREEYNDLIKILPNELPKGIYVAGIHAQGESAYRAKSPQLMIAAEQKYWDINQYIKRFYGYPFQSISIDIFPLDYVPYDEETYKLQRELIILGLSLVGEMKEGDNTVNTENLSRFEEYTGVKIPENNQRYHILKVVDQLSSLYKRGEGDCIEPFMWMRKKPYREEWYDNTIRLPFENIIIPVPVGYDEILKTCYGDYMVYERGTSRHEYPFYKAMESKMKEKLNESKTPYSLDELCDKILNDEVQVNWV